MGSNGSCQVLWRVWCLVGVFGWGNFLRTFGIWFLVVWCELFGWKEIGALLRLKRNRLFNYKLYARVLCLIGLGAGALWLVLPSLSFFLPLVLSPNLLFLSLLLFVAFSCVHHLEHLVLAIFVLSSWLILFLLLTKKKKKKKKE